MILGTKNNKITLALALGVVSIWAILLNKLTKETKPEEQIEINKEQLKYDITIEPPIQHTISSYDRDPFLGLSKKKKPKIKKKEKLNIIWPQIEYLGKVNSSEKNERFHFFKVDGKTKIWSQNETYMDMKMVELKNGVRVILKGERKEFNFKN